MRSITLIWEQTTGELQVNNFQNLTRGDVLAVELYLTSHGSKFLLPSEVNIEAVAKQSPALEPLVKITSFQRPSDTLKPYKAALDLRSTALAEAFMDEVEGGIARLDLQFELQHSDGPTSSQRVLMQVHNEYVRPSSPGELPAEETPDSWLSERAVRHDESQELSEEAKARALANLGIGTGGKVDVQIFTSSGTWVKPEGAKLVKGRIIGGGSGGGSGAGVDDDYGNADGGPGGQAGAVVEFEMLASRLGETEEIVVGQGGQGGETDESGVMVFGADGQNSSAFGLIAVGGKAGTSRTGPAAQNGVSYFGGGAVTFSGAVPGSYVLAGGTGGSGASFQPATNGGAIGSAMISVRVPGGGGGGGGYRGLGGMSMVGGAGGSIGVGSLAVPGGAGGSLDFPEWDGKPGSVDPLTGLVSGSGGGSGQMGGDGADGVFPGGAAGGGGACRLVPPDVLPGKGGNGGAGVVIVVTYC